MFALTGKTIGPYRILEQIGHGGMAMVYKAYQPSMDRYVAIKVLSPHLSQTPEFVKRFQREARAIAKLEHGHILPVHDYGEFEGVAYIVMRYVEAGTLRDRMTAGQLSLDEVNRIIGQIGGALEYARRMGVVHRDVKPGNVLLNDQGDTYLTDFGLARMMEPIEKLTASGVGLGTPAYMSPEQGRGDKVDDRSDIYSLGVILYEMVTGRVPFEAETPMAIVLKHINEPLSLPHTIKPDIPEPVERVILRAMAKDPADRFQTAGEMVQALAIATRETGPKPEGEFVPAPARSTPPREDVSFVTRLQQTWAQPYGKFALAGGGLAIVAALGFLLTSLLRYPITIVAQGEMMTPTTIAQATSTPTLTVVRPTQTAISTRTPALTVTPILPGAILLSEDFENGEPQGFNIIGSDWKLVDDGSGNMVFDVDTTTGVTGDYGRSIYFGSKNWTDYAVEYRVRMLAADANIEMGFRSSDLGDYIQTFNMQSQTVGLTLGLPGEPWHSIKSRSYKLNQGVWYRVRVEAQGENLRIFINDDLILEASDSQHSAGDVAMGNINETHAQFDDIRVIALGETASDSTINDSVLYEEDFEDGKADGLISAGAYWKVASDDDGNKAYEVDTTSEPGGSTIEFGSYDWMDYAIEYRVKLLNPDADIWVNFRNSNQSRYVQRLSLQFDTVDLYSSLGDAPWQSLAEPSYNVKQGVWYLVRIEAQNKTLRVFVNDELIIERTDSKISAGNVAIGNLGNTHALFDDIVVTALGESANATSASTTNAALDACVPAPAGLVGWWPGNGDAQDIAGGNHGELHGGAGFAPGKVGQAFSFDGINDSVDVPYSSSLDIRRQVSIEFWMKPAPGNRMNDCCQGLVNTENYFIEISGSSSSPNPPSLVGVNFTIHNSYGGKQTSDEFDSGFKVPMDIWSYIVGTYDGQQLRLYVDGKLENHVPLPGDIYPVDPNSFLSIGSEDGQKGCGNCPGTRYFDGLIDEVAIYNRALTADEVLSIYSAGEAGKCSVIK